MADQLPDSISPDLAYALKRLALDWLPDHGLVEVRQALALAAQLASASDSPEDLADLLVASSSMARFLAPEPTAKPEGTPTPASAPEPTTAPAPKIKGHPPSRAKSAAA